MQQAVDVILRTHYIGGSTLSTVFPTARLFNLPVNAQKPQRKSIAFSTPQYDGCVCDC